MSGRGRGRGALARWEAAKTIRESSTRVGSSVLSLSREHESKPKVKQSPGDSVNNHTLARVTHIIDVEHFWAQTGKTEMIKSIFSDKNAIQKTRKRSKNCYQHLTTLVLCTSLYKISNSLFVLKSVVS